MHRKTARFHHLSPFLLNILEDRFRLKIKELTYLLMDHTHTQKTTCMHIYMFNI